MELLIDGIIDDTRCSSYNSHENGSSIDTCMRDHPLIHVYEMR